ncbi:MAG: efflux RND transporter periplasmic adaptor subunit [Kiritimatiellia bacterium]|jgi:HlyD family secretion protein
MKTKSKRKLGKTVAAIAVLAAIGIAYATLNGNRSAKAQTDDSLYAPVREGPLVINILEAGSIKPREQIIIKSEVEGANALLYIVPEGTRVQKDQILVELDVSSLTDRRVEQDIEVQNNEAAFINAKENLEIVKNQAKSDVELAELKHSFAEEDLVKYRDGEYPNQLNDTLASVTLAEEELERAKDKYEWSKKLFDESYLSETELKSDELSWKRAELSVKTAKGSLDLLQRYTNKRQIAQLESDVRQARMALERTRSRAASDIVQAEASLRAREMGFIRQRERLDKIDEQIAKARILAPMDGLVIYATSANNRWGNLQPLTEGQEVRERQELIYLPTADTFNAEIDIHESNLKKVYPGLPVRLRVNAVPGRVFLGKVSKISLLPDAQRMWANPDLKVYKTSIEIEGGGDVLKSGMNCEAEIIVEQHASALYVPIQCVARVDKTPAVWVKTPSGPEIRHVEIGLDNNRFVRIVSGLDVGEEVLLAPPLSESVATDAIEVIPDVEIPSLEDYQRRAEAERLATLEHEGESRTEGGERRRPDRRERPPKRDGEAKAPASATPAASTPPQTGLSAVEEARRAASAVVEKRRERETTAQADSTPKAE